MYLYGHVKSSLHIIDITLCSPEEKIAYLEKKVSELIEESCLANSRGELQLVSVFFSPSISLIYLLLFS